METSDGRTYELVVGEEKSELNMYFIERVAISNNQCGKFDTMFEVWIDRPGVTPLEEDSVVVIYRNEYVLGVPEGTKIVVYGIGNGTFTLHVAPGVQIAVPQIYAVDVVWEPAAQRMHGWEAIAEAVRKKIS